jgi:hypothetical protein
MSANKTFQESKQPNHSILARLVKYLHDHDSKDEKRVIAIINKEDCRGKAFIGRNKLECFMNIYEYWNKTRKVPYPSDNHKTFIECWLEGLSETNDTTVDDFDASVMTDDEVKDFVENYYCNDDFDVKIEELIVGEEW